MKFDFSNIPNTLRRVTSKGNFIPEVDGLRFLAIFPVVIQHLSERFTRSTSIEFVLNTEYSVANFIAGRGFVGVYIFFVISGFILSLPFAVRFTNNESMPNLKQYYIRRLTRLEPPYIIAITFFSIVLILMNQYSISDLSPHYIASIFYLHNIIFQSWTPIDPPTWTLEIEIQFYILAPFIAWIIYQIKGKWLRRSGIIIIIFVSLFLQDFSNILHERAFWLTILSHFHYFLIGYLLADIYLLDWQVKPKTKGSILFDFLAIISFTSCLLVWSWDHLLINRILFTISLFLLFIGVFRGKYVNALFRNSWITAIGGMCYSIYLIHLPLAELFMVWSKNLTITNSYTVNLVFQIILFLPLLFIASAMFYLLIEKPCMDKKWPLKLRNFLKLKN